MFGKIHGRSILFDSRILVFPSDNELHHLQFTLSELIETYPLWQNFSRGIARKEFMILLIYALCSKQTMYTQIS